VLSLTEQAPVEHMLVLQGFPICDTPPLTEEEAAEELRIEAELREAKKQARKTGHHLHANGKKLEKNSNARPRPL